MKVILDSAMTKEKLNHTLLELFSCKLGVHNAVTRLHFWRNHMHSTIKTESGIDIPITIKRQQINKLNKYALPIKRIPKVS